MKAIKISKSVKSFFLFYIILILLAFLNNQFCAIEQDEMFNFDNKLIIFFVVVIIGPAVETFVFQYFIYNFFYLLSELFNFPRHKIIVVGVSALAFALVHVYSFCFFVFAYLAGSVFIICYYYFLSSKPFRQTYLLHALVNLTAFLAN